MRFISGACTKPREIHGRVGQVHDVSLSNLQCSMMSSSVFDMRISAMKYNSHFLFLKEKILFGNKEV